MDTTLIARARTLAELPLHRATVTLSLDLDGARRPRIDDCISAFDSLAHQARDAAGRMGEDAADSVDAELDRVREWLRTLERGDTRGAVVVACSATGLFEIITVPYPVADAAAVGVRPRLVELTQVADRAVEHVVVLVDRHRARLFSAVLGVLVPLGDLVEPPLRRHDQGGWSAANLQRHADEVARRHLARTAVAVQAELRSRPYAALLVGGPEEDVAVFEDELSEPARALIAGHLAVRLDAGVEEIAGVVTATATMLEEHREAQAAAQLRSAAGERRGVVGLEATLDAVNDGRCSRVVATVAPPSAPRVAGWRCPACGTLAVAERQCRCGAVRKPEEDVVDALVAAALRRGCGVSWVSDPALLDDAGGVGALLRY